MAYQPRSPKFAKTAPTQEDVERTVSYLTRAFANATFRAISVIGNKAERNPPLCTDLYDYQVDFSYLIDDIQRGPAYIVPKYVQEANDLITGIKALAPN